VLKKLEKGTKQQEVTMKQQKGKQVTDWQKFRKL
jgi:hypothetical protein